MQSENSMISGEYGAFTRYSRTYSLFFKSVPYSLRRNIYISTGKQLVFSLPYAQGSKS